MLESLKLYFQLIFYERFIVLETRFWTWTIFSWALNLPPNPGRAICWPCCLFRLKFDTVLYCTVLIRLSFYIACVFVWKSLSILKFLSNCVLFWAGHPFWPGWHVEKIWSSWGRWTAHSSAGLVPCLKHTNEIQLPSTRLQIYPRQSLISLKNTKPP